jgi:catechol 2,3-dioxygenase-like lactoylglutathione lyase family enzyme
MGQHIHRMVESWHREVHMDTAGINGISHITLIVSDLDRTSHMLEYIFNAEEVYSSGDETHSYSQEKYFTIDGIWFAIMQGESIPGKSYNHVAFKISEEDYDMYLERIKNMGLEIKSDRDRISGEGRSIYFYDYDNHLFELHTGSLEERLRNYNDKGGNK